MFMINVWFVRQFRQNGEVDDDAVGKWLDEGWACHSGGKYQQSRLGAYGLTSVTHLVEQKTWS